MSTSAQLTRVTQYPPGSPFVEAFGLLMASLGFQNGSGPIRAVAVIGARPGDGASTTALNLALTSAGTGRRTLLVDGNVRAPFLHTTFGVEHRPGLADVLSDAASLRDGTGVTDVPNLSFLPAGQLEGSVLALLHPGKLQHLMAEVNEAYEFAVFDLSPLLASSEALHLARFTDGVILVLPSEGAPRRLEMEVRRRLERVGAKIRGIVLNRSDMKTAGRA